MSYVISGLPAEDFRPLFALSDAELAARGVIRKTATASPGFPCRVTLEDAQAGETVLLMNHVSHDVETPYRSAYAIYVREGAAQTARTRDALPAVFQNRPMAFRIFDEAGTLIGAELALPGQAEAAIQRAFAREDAAYLHAHNAAHGCYSARVDRA